ncbi:MAG: FTR1 family protein [Alicyclobacillus sp.]|nr:FTR1 family protein [Alicyclobacillus sp.]
MQNRIRRVRSVVLWSAAAVVVAVLVWQGLTASGAPDPAESHLSRSAAILDTGILVFREGLEAILVLSAIIAGLVRTGNSFWKPIAAGSGLAFGVTIVTWFAVVGLLSSVQAPELDIQAATGLLAVLVLLLVMNWFFHRIYWTGWIAHHNRRKQELMQEAQTGVSLAWRGLVLLGFSAIYREGFEVVLFLQNLRYQVGSQTVLLGTLAGLALTALVAVLTFAAHNRLPYKKMLVFTGILLGLVLVVMVGEEVQEMQQAGWLPTTDLGFSIPDWMGVWFALFPNREGIAAQVLAALFVLGSYFTAEYLRVWRPRRLARQRTAG